MHLNLENKVILLAGQSDLMYVVAKSLLAEKGNVIIISNEEFISKEIFFVDDAEHFIFINNNLLNKEACNEAMAIALEKFNRIDALINFFQDDMIDDIEDADPQKFIDVLSRKLLSAFLITQKLIPQLKNGRGCIVNISVNKNDLKSYNSITALTREWAVDLLKYSIRVNSISVSAIELSKQAVEKQVAATSAFLLSAKSSHTTGQVIHINN